ncbi:GntR family transcriptional regulator [Solirubrobacter pauli]|uniref:GntR family transcriptional regulator n=1 Tax=Solirubrobacter pauli TaxID=166793 RepID=A0A660L8V4_9ACTN|nr:aminotransferase class I/II-fold pyridoxal phosphate-dependent enzyme [Solirubrobacter pauli]RKQ90360.1 GntR family transcriptional regulator [Solirubrobacter pauli]
MNSIGGRTAEEIAGSVRDLVSVGELSAGAMLPPIRALAADLGVNRNTVAAAYRHLVAAGVAETHGRGGTAIAGLPELTREGAAASALVDLASGNPDPRLLPELRLPGTGDADEPVLYGLPAEDPRLVDWAERTFTADVARAFTVVVAHGAVDAVERVLAAHLTRGDAVAVEDPCFLAHIGTLRLSGFEAVPVPVDAAGMTADGLERALAAGVRAVVVTPRAQNPTGASLTATRAAELRAVLARFPHVLVIEDDHFSALAQATYQRVTPPETARWALVRSVTKFLGPDLRVAVLAADDVTAAHVRARLAPAWVSHLLQRLAAHLLEDEATAGLVARARAAYHERARLLVDALDVPVAIPPDGLNVWVDVPGDADRVTAALADLGFHVRPASAFAVGGPTRHALRVTTATLTPEQAEAFATALKTAKK